MEIYPKTGIGKAKFGLKEADVLAIFGQPDWRFEQKEEDEIGSTRLNLEYFDLNLRLVFHEDEGGRLAYLHCQNTDLTFNGHRVIGSKIDFAKNTVFASLGQNWEVDEYEYWQTHGLFEGVWLCLNVEFGRVTEIEIGVPFLENGEVRDWPD